jgi:hypothetical protein
MQESVINSLHGLVGFGGQFGPNYEVAKLQTAADANDSH